MPDRCPWATSTPDYLAYHDDEWGRPVTDDRGLYERLTLEAFQSGLSWITILRKREAFRQVFSGFDPETVARFGSEDVERLLGDARIVRNRAKVEAAVANARALAALHDDGETLAGLVWAARPDPDPPAPTALADVPPWTPASTALAATSSAAASASSARRRSTRRCRRAAWSTTTSRRASSVSRCSASARRSGDPLVQRRRDLELVGHGARALRGEVGDRAGEARRVRRA